MNAAQGNLLDDDKIIATLEKLKGEAADIMQKVAEAESVMEEINRVSDLYRTMGTACSRIYFALEQLDHVHFLYRFSLKFFLDIFHGILYNNPNMASVKDPVARLEILTSDLFKTVYRRVARGLLHEDHITFALRLAQIRLQGKENELDPEEFEFLLKGGEALSVKQLSGNYNNFLNASQQRFLAELSQLQAFKNVESHISSNKPQWQQLLTSSDAENNVPTCWEKKPNSGAGTT